MTDLLKLLRADGCEPRRVSRRKGGEWHGPCPSCGGTDRFISWPDDEPRGTHHLRGSWWCRSCSQGGDTIAYLRKLRGLGYREACAFLGVEPATGQEVLPPGRWGMVPQLATPAQPRSRTTATHSEAGGGPAWRERASLFLAQAEEALWSPSGLPGREWLHGRGLLDSTIKEARLGWISRDGWEVREDWGLPSEKREDGRPKGMWVPAGIVIPALDDEGLPLRLRIRRGKGSPRYLALAGSSGEAVEIPGPADRFLVVESELDGLLLAQEAGDLVAVVALGSVSIRPDEELLARLESAYKVLLALDADEAGWREASSWWRERLPRAEVWPCPIGKDPGEAFSRGMDLRLWVQAGLMDDHAPMKGRKDIPSRPSSPSGDFSTEALLAEVDTWDRGRREEFDERAGIMEFCGGLPRPDAERGAYRLLKGRRRE